MSFEIQRKLPSDADYVSLLYSKRYQVVSPMEILITMTILLVLFTPLNISYRIKMNIDTDTRFYLDPVTINHLNPCITYTFTGNGNWNVAS